MGPSSLIKVSTGLSIPRLTLYLHMIQRQGCNRDDKAGGKGWFPKDCLDLSAFSKLMTFLIFLTKYVVNIITERNAKGKS